MDVSNSYLKTYLFTDKSNLVNVVYNNANPNRNIFYLKEYRIVLSYFFYLYFFVDTERLERTYALKIVTSTVQI